MSESHETCRSCGKIKWRKYMAWGVLGIEAAYRLCVCVPSFANETKKDLEEPTPGIAQFVHTGTDGLTLHSGDGFMLRQSDYAHYEREVSGIKQTPVSPQIYDNLFKKGNPAEVRQIVINGKTYIIGQR